MGCPAISWIGGRRGASPGAVAVPVRLPPGSGWSSDCDGGGRSDSRSGRGPGRLRPRRRGRGRPRPGSPHPLRPRGRAGRAARTGEEPPPSSPQWSATRAGRREPGRNPGDGLSDDASIQTGQREPGRGRDHDQQDDLVDYGRLPQGRERRAVMRRARHTHGPTPPRAGAETRGRTAVSTIDRHRRHVPGAGHADGRPPHAWSAARPPSPGRHGLRRRGREGGHRTPPIARGTRSGAGAVVGPRPTASSSTTDVPLTSSRAVMARAERSRASTARHSPLLAR